MANFQVKNNTANKIEVCGETIEGSATNTIAVSTLYKIPNADQRLADLHNDGTVDIILPAYTAQRYSIAETDALNWLYNTFARSSATTTSSELHVYADGTSGDDANDGLTAATPKKTLDSVFSLIPDIIKHRTAIHLSGTFSQTDGSDYFYFAPVVLNGVVVCIDGGPDITVVADNGGSPWTADISSTSSIGLSTWGKTVDQYRGYWVEILSGPCAGQTRMIHSHTTTTITPHRNFSADPGAAQFRIVRPATSFSGSTSEVGVVVSIVGWGFLHVQRLYLAGSKPRIAIIDGTVQSRVCGVVSDATSNIAIGMGSATAIQYTRNLWLDPATWLYKSATTDPIYGGVAIRYSSADITWQGGLYLEGVNIQGKIEVRAPYYLYVTGGSRIDRLTVSGGTPGNNGFIISSSGYATTRLGSSAQTSGLVLEDAALDLGVIDISNCSSHAIVLICSKLRFDEIVTGSSNGGAGVYAHAGSVVFITDGKTPTLTGTVGDLSTDGSTQKSTWAAIDAGTPVSDTNEMTMAKEV